MISSACRTLSVLEAIGRADEPMGVTQIARQLALQPGTVFRSLNALEQAGFIARFQSSSRYVLGPAVNQLRQDLLGRCAYSPPSIGLRRRLGSSACADGSDQNSVGQSPTFKSRPTTT